MDWERKYLDTAEKFRELSCGKKLLAGFNTNIDRVLRAEDIVEDFPSEKMEKISSWDDFQKVLNFCLDSGKNMEIDLKDYRPEIDGGETFIGGQGGIVSTFISRMGAESVLYTPIVSERLVESIDNEILGVKTGDGLEFKGITECVNSEKFKENLIIEFRSEKSGRLILSDHLEGFQPLFSEDIEDRIDELEKMVDRFFLAGFHHLEKKKIEKAGRQVRSLKSPVHVEYVYTDDRKSDTVVEEILPNADSIGFDEEEMLQVLESVGINDSPEKIEDFVEDLVEVREFTGVERVHLHTYEFHICVVSDSYGRTREQVLEEMVFGEIAAIASAEKGDIPFREDVESFDFEDKHFRGVDEIKEKTDEGIIELDNGFAALIPVVIHEDPERLVGLGDMISAGSFFWSCFQPQ